MSGRWRVEATIAEDGSWESPHTWFAFQPGAHSWATSSAGEFPTWREAYAYAYAMARA